jgi:hypothetical protein
MEPYGAAWSQPVANGRKLAGCQKRGNQAKTVAVGCHGLRGPHGQEGSISAFARPPVRAAGVDPGNLMETTGCNQVKDAGLRNLLKPC